MAVGRSLMPAMALLSFVFRVAAQQPPAPAPVPGNDGTSIDLGVAYILMLIALVLTYLIHPFDIDAASYKFFS